MNRLSSKLQIRVGDAEPLEEPRRNIDKGLVAQAVAKANDFLVFGFGFFNASLNFQHTHKDSSKAVFIYGRVQDTRHLFDIHCGRDRLIIPSRALSSFAPFMSSLTL